MKPLQSYLRTGALVAGLLGATALPVLAEAAPADATTTYGSGAAVQTKIQETWITGSGDSITYTGTNSGSGEEEFGLNSGSLTLAKDPTADALTPPQLDGYIGVDSPITEGQVNEADKAAGSGTQKLLSIPVAQVAETIDLNVPAGLTLGPNSTIKLTNKVAEELFAGTIPANSPYAANTWGALLEWAGWKAVSSSPGENQFVDDGGATGGGAGIKLELRTNGAGATLVLKQYLSWVSSMLANTDWSSTTIDENTEGTGEWPTEATIAGRATSDGKQAEAVAATAGLVGYGTLGAALTTGKFETMTGSTGANHLLIASLQNNGTNSPARYATPEILSGTNTGGSNVYVGKKINTTGTYKTGQVGVGNWIVPSSSGKINTTGVWTSSASGPSGYSHAWDDDVYDDSESESTAYPLVIALWDNTWDEPAWGTGLLQSPDYNAPATIKGVVKSYFEFVTSTAASKGQSLAYGAHFAPLPAEGTGLANIQADAAAIAAAI